MQNGTLKFQNNQLVSVDEKGLATRVLFQRQGQKSAKKQAPPIPPIPPISPQLYANALFVDAVFGDDTNAAKYSLMDSTTNVAIHKYKSIIAATNAALPGELIIVYPGIYFESNNLYKDGISYYFYPNAVVNSFGGSAIFQITGANHVCKIYGKADFYNQSTGGVVRSVQHGTIYFEANDVRGLSNPIEVKEGFAEIIIHDLSSDQNAAVNIFTGYASPFSDNSVSITANIIKNDTNNGNNSVLSLASNANAGFKGNIKIVANKLIGSAFGNNHVVEFRNRPVAGTKTLIEVTAKSIETPLSTNGQDLVFCWLTNDTDYILNGNVNVPVGLRTGIVFLFGYSNSKFTFNGNVTTFDGVAVNVGNTTGLDATLNGIFKSTGSAPNTINISPTSANVYINGQVINSFAGGNGINKTVSAPAAQLIAETLKIITNAGLSINAPALDTIKVIHSLAVNTPTSPAIGAINSIVGSVAYQDAGVI